MVDFTNSVFLAPNPTWYNTQGGRGKDTKLVDALDSASRRMSGELKGDALSELTLRTTLAGTFQSLSMFERAGKEAESAAKLLPAVTGQAPKVEAQLMVFRCEMMLRQVKYHEAEPLCREAVIQARRLGGTPNRLLLQAASHLGNSLLALSGKSSEAESLYREALAAIPQPSAADAEGVLSVRQNLAYAKMARGDFRGAAEDFRGVLAAYVSTPDAAGESALTHSNLGNCYRLSGDLAAAEAEYGKALQIATATPIGNEPRTLAIPLYLYLTWAMEGKVDQAESGLRELKTRIEKVTGAATGLQGYLYMVEGVCALKRGDGLNAERRLRSALEVYRATLRPTHVYIAEASSWLASALDAQGRIGEARAAAEEAVRIWEQNYPVGNPVLEEARSNAEKLSE
jgi:tetratricopeptide (TPR) repeat protein